jgi:hypothetical protein
MLGDLANSLGTADIDAIGSALAVARRENLIETYSLTWEGVRGEVRAGPTGAGAELFLWGHGVRPVVASSLLNPTLRFSMLTKVPAVHSARLDRQALD